MPSEELLNRDGKPFIGIGRLDQIIGAAAAEKFSPSAKKEYGFCENVLHEDGAFKT